MKTIKLLISAVFLVVFLSACNLPSNGIEPVTTNDGTAEPVVVETETQQETEITPSSEVDVFERSMTDQSDSPKYEIQAVWPNLTESTAHSQIFNQAIDTLVQTAQIDFLDNVNSQPAPGDQGTATSTLAIDYDLTYAGQGLYSVQLVATQYIAVSVHPFTTSHTLNFDANQGVFLMLSDLFLPGSDFMEAILGQVDSALVERGFDYQPGTAADVMVNRENWNLVPEGLRINFDEYEVAPYAAGPQYVLIPWNNLAQWLKPEGPAGVFITL